MKTNFNVEQINGIKKMAKYVDVLFKQDVFQYLNCIGNRLKLLSSEKNRIGLEDDDYVEYIFLSTLFDLSQQRYKHYEDMT